MKSLEQIIQRVVENPTRPWALATLVQTQGSTYRKPGARMLVDRDGGTLGVLSGGCLEEEIGRRGKDVIENDSPVLLDFDTKRLYGCDGQLKILLEPLRPAEPDGNLITRIGRLLSDRKICRVRICFAAGALGSKLIAVDTLVAERQGILIDTVPLPIRLLLFGSGPEVKPITQLATNLGWLVHLFSHPSEIPEDFRPDAQTAAVIMNHHFGRDLLALDRSLSLQLCYVGLLGSRKRRAELLTRLSEYRADDFISSSRNLFSPAGLDIGSETPEEIALAIVSEVAAVLANRGGGSLRDRTIDIHPANVAAVGGEAA